MDLCTLCARHVSVCEVPEAMYDEERLRAIEGRRVSDRDRKEVVAGKERKKTMSSFMRGFVLPCCHKGIFYRKLTEKY